MTRDDVVVHALAARPDIRPAWVQTHEQAEGPWRYRLGPNPTPGSPGWTDWTDLPRVG